jgi:hypothetical protein
MKRSSGRLAAASRNFGRASARRSKVGRLDDELHGLAGAAVADGGRHGGQRADAGEGLDVFRDALEEVEGGVGALVRVFQVENDGAGVDGAAAAGDGERAVEFVWVLGLHGLDDGAELVRGVVVGGALGSDHADADIAAILHGGEFALELGGVEDRGGDDHAKQGHGDEAPAEEEEQRGAIRFVEQAEEGLGRCGRRTSGGHRCLRRKRHIIGERVSETNADVSTLPTSTTPNSRKRRPVRPSRKMMGTKTAASVIVVEMTAK